MIEIREYVDPLGRSPFRLWRSDLDVHARAKIATALERLSAGNTSHVKSLGEGVSEIKIDFGPGYRIYFGRDGVVLVLLLGGGTKKRQQRDIEDAQRRWAEYRRRKQQEMNHASD
jgi:putative addiction module killer protein